LHGHNYTVEVILSSGVLDPDSFVKDFGALKPIKQFIDEKLDHRHLNDVMVEFEDSLISHLSVRKSRNSNEWLAPSDEAVGEALRTTSENLARALYLRFKPDLRELRAVRVSETPKTWAEYREEDR
jgi:6-pyruvoyltetrahydropterin/6-carboxytetrahydropterin synthase